MVYNMHIQKYYLVYTWHIQYIFSLKFFDIHSIYMVYVMHIQKIYLGYTWHIQWIFSLKFFDIHSIYTVYVMHIWSINIIFAIKNVPCPCTCHVPFHLDSAVALALFPTQRESPVCLWKGTHGQSPAVAPWDTSSLGTASWDTVWQWTPHHRP